MIRLLHPAPSTRHASSLLLLTLFGMGCSDGPGAPSPFPVEGQYVATTFTATATDTTFDLLAEGVTLTLVLESGGQTSGTLIVPEATTALAGTWDAMASTVHLHLAGPNLLNLVEFVIEPGELVGDWTVGAFTYHLTLTRQGATSGSASRWPPRATT